MLWMRNEEKVFQYALLSGGLNFIEQHKFCELYAKGTGKVLENPTYTHLDTVNWTTACHIMRQ